MGRMNRRDRRISESEKEITYNRPEQPLMHRQDDELHCE